MINEAEIVRSLLDNVEITAIYTQKLREALAQIIICAHDLKKMTISGGVWIPANTVSLPEEFEHVLVTDGKTVTTGTIYEAGGEKYWRVQNEPLLPIAVTHWMPLPKPPKEENDGTT